jgi:hypothetical protein
MPNELATTTATPLAILQQAYDKGADLATLTTMTDLAIKWEEVQERKKAKEAQTAYRADMAEAQSEMIRVVASTPNPQTGKKYADYAAVDRMARPIYTIKGFSLSFDTADGAPPDYVRVVCDINHRDGHSERKHIDMPTDGKGAKGGDVMTKTHATGSAVTYGMRQLAKMIWNIAIGDDDDGNAAGAAGHAKIVAESCEIIAKSETLEKLQENFATPFGVAEKQNDKPAMKAYTEARDARKAELEEVENRAWAKRFDACETVDDFNKYIVPSMKTDGSRFKMAAAKVAKDRGWRADKATETFVEVAK